MRVIGIAGWSGAGKTMLIVKLIPLLMARGLRVSTLKHAHHAFDIDKPGKDSYEHRKAGARQVLIASARRFALLNELQFGEAEPSLPELLRRFDRTDLVLVEGFKSQTHVKIEVHRAANGKPLLYGEVPNVCAIATDLTGLAVDVPVLGLDDLDGISRIALAKAEPVEDLLRRLEALPIPLAPPRRA